MKKAGDFFIAAIAFILVVVYVIWSRVTDQKWLVILIPFALIAIFIVIALIIDKSTNKKKGNVVDQKFHPILGEITYGGVEWNRMEKEKVALWNQNYEIPLSFIAESESEDVSEDQLTSLREFRDVIVKQRRQIEELLMEELECNYKEECLEKFKPVEISFSQDGKCMLSFQDPEVEYDQDVDTEIALFLLPELKVLDGESASEVMLGFSDL